ncbi:hypothetical protein HY948_00110 [Candidatus Gottesmanbacteria bacterium]|nr:hypothetical protein [Candidatus Gottesmanbacteria bacterium]
MMKRLELFTISTALSLLVGFVCLELILRAQHYEPYPSPWSFVTEVGKTKSLLFSLDRNKIYSIQKNIYISEYDGTDQYGYRFVYRPRLTGKESFYEIVMIGDSFTYGQGVIHDQAYPAVLEQLFHQKKPKVIVHNAGISGYSPDQEYVYIKEILSHESPDMIIWNFNMNDINDANESCLIRKIGNNYLEFPGWLNSLYVQGLLIRHMPEWLFQYAVTNFVVYAPNRISGLGRITLGCTEKGTLTEVRKAMFQKIQYLIREMQRQTKKRNIQLVVTLAPFQWYFDEAQDYRHWSVGLYSQLRDTLKNVGEIFIDVNDKIAQSHDPALLSLRTRSEGHPVYIGQNALGINSDNLAYSLFRVEEMQFPFGWKHLNALGNRYFAEAVYDSLKDIIP